MMSRTGSRRRGSPGFSLIEVLIAALVLFAGLVAVLRAYSASVAVLEAATGNVLTLFVLSERLAAAEAAGLAGAGPGGGGAGIENIGPYSVEWQSGVTAEADRRYRVTASGGRAGTDRRLQLDTVVADRPSEAP